MINCYNSNCTMVLLCITLLCINVLIICTVLRVFFSFVGYSFCLLFCINYHKMYLGIFKAASTVTSIRVFLAACPCYTYCTCILFSIFSIFYQRYRCGINCYYSYYCALILYRRRRFINHLLTYLLTYLLT